MPFPDTPLGYEKTRSTPFCMCVCVFVMEVLEFSILSMAGGCLLMDRVECVLGALQESKESLKVHASAFICLTAPNALSYSSQTLLQCYSCHCIFISRWVETRRSCKDKSILLFLTLDKTALCFSVLCPVYLSVYIYVCVFVSVQS